MKRTRTAGILLFGLLFALAFLPGLLVVKADFGSNWSATFFNSDSPSGTGPSFTGIAAINFNWGVNPPTLDGITPVGISNCTSTVVQPGAVEPTCKDYFYVRFTSTQNLTPGTYQFVVASDDGVRVTVNGSVIIDHFTPHAAATDTATVSIPTSPVNITVDYFEGIDQALIQVQWFLQGAAGTAFPGLTPSPLYTAVPALTVSVDKVKGLSVRSGPYLGASLITVARPGTEYPPIARNKDEGQFTWYLITVGDKTGWVSSRYLKITGDPNGVGVQSTIFEQIDNAPDLGVIASPRSIMHLRRRPSVRTAVLADIPWGAELQLLGRTVQGGDNFWYQVRYNNMVGWIYAPFVSTRGNIDAVPVR